MKKGIKNLAIATMVGVASMGLMTGCGKGEDKPYIEVSGLDTTYIQNEELNLDGAKILYYSDKDDKSADEIKLEASMVANFNTETTGEKKLKVMWNNFEWEVEYIVETRDAVVNKFVTAYNTARTHIINNQTFSETIINDGILRYVNVLNNSVYAYAPNLDKDWIKKEGDTFVKYTYDVQNNTYLKRVLDQNALIVEDNITMFLPQGGEMTTEQLEGGEIDYVVEGDKVTYTLDFMEIASHTMEFTFSDGKILGFKGIVPTNAEKTEFKIQMEATYSYNINDIEIEDLPTGVTWEDAVED